MKTNFQSAPFMEYIERKISDSIKEAVPFFPVIVITGPRQTGKTTLVKHLFTDYTYYNLEDPLIRLAVEDNPRDFILKGNRHMIIDEIQHFHDLFSYIQVCVDEDRERKFVITGSSDFALMEKITQSLAGRAALFTLLPFSFKELPEYTRTSSTDSLLFNGFYPGVIVKQTPPKLFYSNYCNTYAERDVRLISTFENLDSFRLFMRLLAGRTGTEFNALSLCNETGVSAPTIRKWLGILKTSYIVFTLPPYHTNIDKRLTKTPKIYFYDTGLLCNLLGIYEAEVLLSHPLRGAIFENLAVVEFLKERYNENKNPNLYFYKERNGREVDILKTIADKFEIYEVKSSGTFNKSFLNNLNYLKKTFGEKILKSVIVYDGPSISTSVQNIRNI